jgi:hypothetical protein
MMRAILWAVATMADLGPRRAHTPVEGPQATLAPTGRLGCSPQGLQGKSVVACCHEYHINQRQSYQWRDPWLANASKAFEAPQDAQTAVRWGREQDRCKPRVGALTGAFKKSAEWLD